MKRRTLFKVLGTSALIGTFYSLWRGIRYPRLSYERYPLPDVFESDSLCLFLKDCFVSQGHRFFNNYADTNDIVFIRAFVPEPTIQINRSSKEQTLLINNISPDATLFLKGANSKLKKNAKEITHGITRVIRIPIIDQPIFLHWKLPRHESYEFATIGDTGGADELGWCIKRAHQLGVKFFIHLGDFSYQASDYETAIEQFVKAPLPCYITIGNHDFNDDGLIVDKFLADLGPLNHSFNIQNIRFANIDTAASFLPISGGKRADLMRALMDDKKEYDDTVAFTHRPFFDPRPEEDHDFGNVFEKKWFVKCLKIAKIDTIIAGHIHNFFDTESEDIRILISGQGLAHEDLIHKRQVAKMLIGNITQRKKVVYRAEPLAMPFEFHCHPYVIKNWHDNDNVKPTDRVDRFCKSTKENT